MVSKTFEGKSYAGDPHIWFDEENGVSAKPRRSSHLWRMLRKRCVAVFSLYVVISFTGRCDADCQVFPSLLSYLNRQGVVVENVTGRQGISNKFFTHCEVAGSELVKEGCVKLLKTNATLEWRSLNEDVLQILCAGRGRTAVSEISRSFEKDSGRMISFELQRFVSAGEDEDRIVGKIWSRDLTSAGFFGGRVDQISSSERCYRFERVDEIEAELSVDSIGDRQTRVRLTVRLPEDFQLRNDRARRENGWQDPRFFDL